MLANPSIALYLMYAERDREILAEVLPAETAIGLLPPDRSDENWAVDVRPFSKNLTKLLQHGKTRYEDYPGLVPYSSTLAEGMNRFMTRLERLAPDLLKGRISIGDIEER